MARANVPIMSADAEKFMAYSGLVQWTQAVGVQVVRLRDATRALWNLDTNGVPRIELGGVPRIYALLCEQHYFVIATHKLLEHRDWITKFGLFADVDFTEIDSFSRADLKDLRDMREHVVDYFKGDGREKARWTVETPEFGADASSSVGTMIGGRLDYEKFAAAAGRLLSQLLAEPIPYPLKRD
jgi:hypothetical protein